MSSALITLITLAAAPGVFAQVGVHCGTTSDATFSDCQALTDPATWSSAWAADSNVCHYSNPDDLFAAPAVAYNTACHGNCCSKNKINGLLFTEQTYGIFISNGKGCGDCFDDKDFSGGCANC
ncbi:hypothetical protein DFH09DRAFT_1254042 [Mycena vulgaris]|nr:hypothetical protein DFH09DRAFT_1254042 [Mycena vulgaris]